MIPNDTVRLWDGPQERETYDALSVIYSIIATLEHLEKAYVRDSVSSEQYAPLCRRLLAQYQTLMSAPNVQKAFAGGVDEFLETYGAVLPAGAYRVKVGIPATLEHADSSATTALAATTAAGAAGGGSSTGPAAAGGPQMSLKLVAEATKDFINLMDALKIDFRAKDQLHPLLADLIQSVTALPGLQLDGRGAIVRWLIRVNSLTRAGEQISEAEVREMFFEIESAYNEFLQKLND